MEIKRTPTPEMRAFLLELAALLAKHEVEIEGAEESGYGDTVCSGIEFQILAKQSRETCIVETKSKYVTASDIEILANTQ